MESEVQDLEDKAWLVISQWNKDEAHRCAIAALQAREKFQGEEHPDLAWPLSLLISLTEIDYSLVSVKAAANLAERRLVIRRSSLTDAPNELLLSLKELASLYYYEDEAFNPKRIAELKKEIKHFSRQINYTNRSQS